MWAIIQNGDRKKDRSTNGAGTSPDAPSRKLVAVCRTEKSADRWLGRLKQWAAEGAGPDGRAAPIPTYEVASVEGLADLDPTQFVGRDYFDGRGFARSLRKMTRAVRASHAALRRELRRRGSAD
jgi:hypothetical protein